jgi:hypothetical protein
VDGAFDVVFGLPLHPLVVHIVVILVPVAALGAAASVVHAGFGRRYLSAVVVIAVVAAGASLISRESGEQLALRTGTPQPHAELGAVLPVFTWVFAIAVLVFWLFARGVPGNRRRPVWLRVLGVAVVVAAVLALWWTIRVGHSGAEAVWAPVVSR